MMAAPKTIPEIRYAEFAGEWEKKKLGEITESFSGGTPSVGHAGFYGGDIPFIRSAEIASNSTELFITDAGLKQSSAKLVDPGDILYALYGATSGEVDVSRIHGAINQAILAMRPTQGDDPYLIVQWLTRQKNHIVKTYLQGGQGNLSGSIVKDLILLLPCNKSEQIQVGKLFSTLDTLITLHQREHDKTVNLKKAVLEKMFPKEGASRPEVRFAGFSGDWERQDLKDFVEFSKGRGYSKGDLRESGTPIILYGRLYTKYETEIYNIDTFVMQKEDSILSQGNEVIVPASGETAEDISRAAVVKNSGIILGGDLNILKLNADIDSTFLAIIISSGTCQKELSKRAQGKSVVHIHNSDMETITITLPKLEEQCKISAHFRKIDRLITLQQQHLTKLKNMKKALLEKMFV